MERKVVKTGKEAREATRNALTFVGDVVKSTLGPGGKNAIIDRERPDYPPMIVNDGVTIIQELYMDDECEYQVMQSIVEAASQTNDEAGDGTTTATTLTQAIGLKGLDKLPEPGIVVPGGLQPQPLARQIQEESELVIAELEKMAEPVDTLERLQDVAFSSLEDRTIGDVVAGAVFEVGKDGYVTLEEGYNQKVESEVVPGMKIYGKYAAEYQITNARTKKCVVTNAPVVVSNATVTSLSEFNDLVQDMNVQRKATSGKDYNALVIMAAKFEAEAIRQAWKLSQEMKEKGAAFKFVFCKVPSLTPDELKDVAAFLDAKFIDVDTKMGESLSQARNEHLGYCDRIEIGENETAVIGGRGLTAQVSVINPDDKEADPVMKTRVEARIDEVKDQVKLETDKQFKKKAERRLGILSGGIGIVKVGAQTHTEKVYLKFKIEDALNACQNALRDGVVPGGGVALNNIAQNPKFKGMFIASCLEAPFKTIQSNAGGSLEIGPEILDPVTVTRAALKNAVSIAKTLITNSTIIALRRQRVDEDLREILAATPDNGA